jgi:hypothetical protein
VNSNGHSAIGRVATVRQRALQRAYNAKCGMFIESVVP